MKPSAHRLTAALALLVVSTVSARAEADPIKVAELSQAGWTLLQQGKPAEADKQFRAALALAPEDPASLNGLGWTLMNTGRHPEAEAIFQKLVTAIPNHPAALNGLGQIYLARRDYAKAEPPFLKAAALGASASWYGLTRMYLLQGKYPEAEKYAQMLADSGQADPIAQKMLEAAKSKSLPDALRQTIEPPPAKK